MITYPVDVQNDRFTFVKDGITYRHKVWPRADGQQLQNAEAGLVIMHEVNAPLPPFNPATERLDEGVFVDDPANQVTTFTRGVVALTQAELDAIAENTDRDAKRVLVAQAIPTLRQWSIDAAGTTATSGNAVAVLNTILQRLSVFFNRFADLLEVQRIDK
jgi:hypothetical protein